MCRSENLRMNSVRLLLHAGTLRRPCHRFGPNQSARHPTPHTGLLSPGPVSPRLPDESVATGSLTRGERGAPTTQPRHAAAGVGPSPGRGPPCPPPWRTHMRCASQRLGGGRGGHGLRGAGLCVSVFRVFGAAGQTRAVFQPWGLRGNFVHPRGDGIRPGGEPATPQRRSKTQKAKQKTGASVAPLGLPDALCAGAGAQLSQATQHGAREPHSATRSGLLCPKQVPCPCLSPALSPETSSCARTSRTCVPGRLGWTDEPGDRGPPAPRGHRRGVHIAVSPHSPSRR